MLPALGAPWFWEATVPLAFAAIFVALLCYGIGGVLKAVGAALGSIPLIFGFSLPLGKIWDSFTLPLANWLVGAGDSLLGFVANIFKGMANSLVSIFEWLKSAIVNHAVQIEYLHNSGLPASARAAANTAQAYSDFQLQLVRTELHAAQVKWEQAHSYADAQTYIALELTAPSVEHAFLAAQGRTLIAAEVHAQDLHDQLRDYIGRNITGQADVAKPYNGQTLTGVEGAIAIPWGTAIPSIDVQDLIKAGEKVAVGTAVAVIATKIVDCLVSNCAGNNNFSQLLQDALGVLTAVEIGEFLSDVISNPAGVLVKYENELKGIVPATGHAATDVLSAIESVIGI